MSDLHAAVADLEAERDALKALAAPVVPPGFKLVPIEPTPEMVDAAVSRQSLALQAGLTSAKAMRRALQRAIEVAPSPQEPTNG